MKDSFSIVEFEDGIECVPKKWLTSDQASCYWPQYKNSFNFEKAVRLQEPVADSWKPCSVKKILGTAKNYERAREKLNLAMEQSDLNTDDNNPPDRLRTRKKRSQVFDSDSESDQNENYTAKKSKIPPFPTSNRYISFPRTSIAVSPTSDISQQNNLAGTPSSVFSRSSRLFAAVKSCDVESHISRHDEDQNRNTSLQYSNLESGHEGSPLTINADSPRREGSLHLRYLKDLKRQNIAMSFKMEALIENQKQLMEWIKNISNSSKEVEDEQIELEYFPIGNGEQLEKIEDRLHNKECKKKLVKELVQFSTGCVKTTVSRILNQLFTNEFARKYSFFGKKGKKDFSKLSLCAIIMESVRTDIRMKSATNIEIQTPILIWLRHASERASRQSGKNNEL